MLHGWKNHLKHWLLKIVLLLLQMIIRWEMLKVWFNISKGSLFWMLLIGLTEKKRERFMIRELRNIFLNWSSKYLIRKVRLNLKPMTETDVGISNMKELTEYYPKIWIRSSNLEICLHFVFQPMREMRNQSKCKTIFIMIFMDRSR